MESAERFGELCPGVLTVGGGRDGGAGDDLGHGWGGREERLGRTRTRAVETEIGRERAGGWDDDGERLGQG